MYIIHSITIVLQKKKEMMHVIPCEEEAVIGIPYRLKKWRLSLSFPFLLKHLIRFANQQFAPFIDNFNWKTLLLALLLQSLVQKKKKWRVV